MTCKQKTAPVQLTNTFLKRCWNVHKFIETSKNFENKVLPFKTRTTMNFFHTIHLSQLTTAATTFAACPKDRHAEPRQPSPKDRHQSTFHTPDKKNTKVPKGPKTATENKVELNNFHRMNRSRHLRLKKNFRWIPQRQVNRSKNKSNPKRNDSCTMDARHINQS